jgi:hypothetical protein
MRITVMPLRPLLLALLLAAPVTAQEPATSASTASTAPLPEFATLFAGVRTHQDELESLRRKYICTMQQTADELDKDGGSKKQTTEEYEVFFLNGTEVRRRLRHNGKELSPSDAKKEQEHVDKEVADLKAGKKPKHGGDVNLSVSRLLKLATFSNGRRIRVNGRDQIFYDFTGNPKADTNGLSDEIMRRLDGTVAIDEQDQVVSRLEAHLASDFKIGGGMLANVHKGSRFTWTQAPVRGEIWLPETLDVNVDGRVLLFKGFQGAGKQRFYDYRKLDATVRILPDVTKVSEEEAKPE